MSSYATMMVQRTVGIRLLARLRSPFASRRRQRPTTAANLKIFALLAALTEMLLPTAAVADSTKLRLAVFTSHRSSIYTAAVKPFADAVNAEAKGLLDIEVYFDGALGKAPEIQAQLVATGVADLAFIIPGYSQDRFPDTALIELPGLFRDGREATLVYSQLTASGKLEGYEDFVVIGTFASEPETIHTNRPVASLSDLVGLRIRANNPAKAMMLAKFGKSSVASPINLVSEAIGSGRLDGTLLSPNLLFDFQMARVVSHHYLLPGSVVPVALVMSRAKFDSLPENAQNIIRKYSGEWAAARYNYWSARNVTEILTQLNADPHRKVVFPSRQDRERAQAVYKSVIDEWAAQSPHNRELLTMVEAEIARLRRRDN